MKQYIVNYVRIDGQRKTLVINGLINLINILQDLRDEDEGMIIEIFTW